jgi:hypothetical protein
MSTILPPPPTPVPLPTAPPAPVVIVTSPPVALAELAVGTTVRADVVALLTRGLAEVETDLGTFQIRSNIALRVGAELDLQLLKSGAQVQLAIRTLDGHTVPGQPGAATGGIGLGSSGGGAVGSAQANAAHQSQTAAQSEALGSTSLHGAVTQAAPTARPAATLVIGATVNATLLPHPAATDTAQPRTTVSLAAQTAAGTSSAATGAPTTAIGQSPLRPDATGTRLELRLLSIVSGGGAQIPVSHAPTATAGSIPNTISGTVTTFTPSGKPIVETPTGLLSLDTDADVRIGQKLTFTVVPPAQRADGGSGSANFLESFVHRKSWPTLEQAATFLAQRAHEAASGSTASPGGPPALPILQANSQLAQNLLSATAALGDGNIRTWLGDLANTLEQDQPNLFQRLSDEFAQLARMAAEPKADDWRTALLPFFTGAAMEPVQMHLRGEKQPKGEKKKDGGSRFVIDLNLSNLGRFQLDGFMKDRGETKNFDLIVRTETPLPQRMRFDINQIFTDFAEVAGLRGGISFQARGQFVDVPLSSLQHRDGGVVV